VDILSYILAIISQIADYLVSIIEYVGNLLIAIAQYIWDGLVFVANFFWGVVTKVSAFFHNLWDGFFKNILGKVFTLFRKVQAFLEAKLRPIINAIKTIRAYWDKIFKIYVKPILDMMQHVRQVLGVFRALGFKWAAALDKRIAGIEGAISSIYSQVRGVLNGVLDVLNQLTDPWRLIRRPMLLLSIRRLAHASVRLFTGLPPGYYFPSPRSAVAVGLGKLPLGFNASDPAQNPPASAYLPGNDGLGNFSGFSAGYLPDDTDVDGATMLDYFNDALYPDARFGDAAQAAHVAFVEAFSNPFVE
jgi:hypothetical protein